MFISLVKIKIGPQVMALQYLVLLQTPAGCLNEYSTQFSYLIQLNELSMFNTARVIVDDIN